LRQHYGEFQSRDTEVLAVGPDGPRSFQLYWQEHDMPFPGLSDHDNAVADRYAQEVHLLKFGRMPAVLVVDKQGRIRYQHYGESMSDITTVEDLLKIVEGINQEK
jgi:peroxiredoxin